MGQISIQIQPPSAGAGGGLEWKIRPNVKRVRTQTRTVGRAMLAQSEPPALPVGGRHRTADKSNIPGRTLWGEAGSDERVEREPPVTGHRTGS